MVQVDGDHREAFPALHQAVDQLVAGEPVRQSRKPVRYGLLPQPVLVFPGPQVVVIEQEDDQYGKQR